jgi:hypothetical protein
MCGKDKPADDLGRIGLNDDDFRSDGSKIVEANRFLFKANGTEAQRCNAASQVIPPFMGFRKDDDVFGWVILQHRPIIGVLTVHVFFGNQNQTLVLPMPRHISNKHAQKFGPSLRGESNRFSHDIIMAYL